MQQTSIEIRRATADDATNIVEAFIMAVGGDEIAEGYCGPDYRNVLKEIVLTKGTQYHYDNALIAETEGAFAGATIGYNGANLKALRAQTLNVIKRHYDATPAIDPETEAGEFYIDTLAVAEAMRGRGIGRQLLEAACERAFDDGHTRVGLLVDMGNPKAETLYTSSGFVRAEEKLFLGHRMWHMIREKNI